MPGYRGHLVGGALVYGCMLYILKNSCDSIWIGAQWLLFTLSGSLFPDIDTKSMGQKIVYQFLFIILIVLALQRKFFALAIMSLFSFIPLIVRHRGLFHKFWFVIAFPASIVLILSLYAPNYTRIIVLNGLFFVIGGISHLFLDFVVKR